MQNSDYFSRLIAQNEAGPNMPAIKSGVDSVWFCESCKKDHSSCRGAQECCNSYDPKLEHICLGCEKSHASADDAAKCCLNVIAPLICPVCMSRTDSYEEAIDCCLHMHPNLSKTVTDRLLIDVKNGKSWSEALSANVHH